MLFSALRRVSRWELWTSLAIFDSIALLLESCSCVLLEGGSTFDGIADVVDSGVESGVDSCVDDVDSAGVDIDDDNVDSDVDDGPPSDMLFTVVVDDSCRVSSDALLGKEVDDDDDEDTSGVPTDVSCTLLGTERRLFEGTEDCALSKEAGDVSFLSSTSGKGFGRFDSSGNVSESELTLRS